MDMSAFMLRSQKFAEDMNLYFILDQFSLSCTAVKTKSNVLNFKVKTALLKTWERFYLKLWLEDYKFKIFTVLISLSTRIFNLKIILSNIVVEFGKKIKKPLSNFNNAYIIADIFSYFFFILLNSLKNFQMFFFIWWHLLCYWFIFEGGRLLHFSGFIVDHPCII